MNANDRLDEVLRKLKGASPSGSRPHQYAAHCPAHDDSDKSFAAGIGDNGHVCLRCFTGCEIGDILAALDMTPRDLFADNEGKPFTPSTAPAVDPHDPPEVWEERCAAWAANFDATPSVRAKLAAALDIPESAFAKFPGLGARADHERGACFTFPERDAQGRITGAGLRFMNGDKRSDNKSKRGLTLPTGWDDHTKPLYLVEGPSDVLAMIAAGCCAVGRPGVSGGVKLLAELIRTQVPKDRRVVVMGEHDKMKPSKANPNILVSPGRDEALKMARKLAAEVPDHRIEFAMPPNAEDKDMRRWATRLVMDGCQWCELEDRLSKFLKPSVVKVRHEGSAEQPPAGAPAGGDDKDNRPTIMLWPGCDESAVVDRAIEIMKDDPALFVRSRTLSRVIFCQAHKTNGIKFPSAPVIMEVDPDTLRGRLTKHLVFTEPHKKEGLKTIVPPDSIVRQFTKRCYWPGLRPVHTVVSYPFLRPDGTVMMESGYDPQTGVYLDRQGDKPIIPDVCDRDAALKAVEALWDVVCDFPFAKECGRVAWLCGLLTTISRFSYDSPVPLFVVDGNTPGSGKSKLANIAGLIATGQVLPTTPYSHDDEEMRKKFTTLALFGTTQILLDNVKGAFGGPIIDAIITSTVWQDRILGSNTLTTLPWFAVPWVTGNNIQLDGDSLRRIIVSRLWSPLEHPENRTGFKHANLTAWVLKNRAVLLGHAFTILLAHHRAGKPDMGLVPLGSFEGWSETVRNAVVWLGLPDPTEGKDDVKIASDPMALARMVLIDNWNLIDPEGKGMTANQIVTTVFPPPREETPDHLADVAEAIDSVCNKRTGKMLAAKFKVWQETVTCGRMLVQISTSGRTVRWGVIKAPKSSVGESGESGGSFSGQVPQELGSKVPSQEFLDNFKPKMTHLTHQTHQENTSGTGFASLDTD